MIGARVAAQALELLGPIDGPMVVVGGGATLSSRLPAARDGEAAAAAICSFLGEPADAAARGRCLDAIAARLVPGAPLVVVDHNQPRAWWPRVLACVPLALRGLGPSRARHPVAREVRDHGFTIERLRFAAGERVQLVLARRC
ncbi:MAG TPA: hypothetical protein VMS22_00545 [Candidatus Eisenbacteria bacterium]|nr:hypothetical protein [Candidatus Eisenbacteria bacterium]